MYDNWKRVLSLSIFIFVSLIISACSNNFNNSESTSWEYLQVTVICDTQVDPQQEVGNTWKLICFQPLEPDGFAVLIELDQILNKYGSNGWELVSADRETIGYAEGIYMLIFKQPKP
jgi:hypothetical protein